ncbi:hypothetical protein GQ53DRAFT_748692 [Thozetella sp. PMI_491]|nr:hypothetical protein GQ53DRAFT_748692 [Thozetella sp. PMI_491]
MAPDTESAAPSGLEAGPFVLRPLFRDMPLSPDGASEDIKINCVDYLDRNLYVGTSASELLHFVQIPPDPADPSSSPVFILASRLRPVYSEAASSPNGGRPGVQQILLLPRVGKACVLCNWTVTFYSLPELSPVFGTTQVKNCNWIGGVDLNEDLEGSVDPRSGGVTILLSLNRRIQVVRIGEDARVVKKIDFSGSTLSVRRDNIACVADSRNYALLDVDRQLKIPLMSISSLDDSQSSGPIGKAQNISAGPDGGLSRSASSATSRLEQVQAAQSHSRSTSLGGFIAGSMRKKLAEGEDLIFQEHDPPAPSRSPGPSGENTHQGQKDSDKPLPAPPGNVPATSPLPIPSTPSRVPSPPKPGLVFLKPHIVSPTPEEFLLVTGTGPLDPGIGMFVNLDGDPTRPTLEFDKYPREIAVDGASSDFISSGPSLTPEGDGYVLASMTKELGGAMRHGLEIQKINANDGEGEHRKFWLERSSNKGEESIPLGLRSLLQGDEVVFQELVDRLCQRRFLPFATGASVAPSMSLRSMDSRTALSMERQSKEQELFDRDLDAEEEPLPEGWESTRNKEEEEFVRRLAKTNSQLAVWAGNDIWWAVRNPLLLQLEAAAEAASRQPDQKATSTAAETRLQLLSIPNSIRGRDARTELEFMTFSYVRQKVGVMLLTSFLGAPFGETEQKAMEEVLLEGSLDPRVVLALIPALRNEIVESRRGTWIYEGIKTVVDDYISSLKLTRAHPPVSSLPPEVLQFLRRFLASWRKKKGFGSIADESEVFKTVDASLLLVLLELDQSTLRGTTAKHSPIRAELYEVVDHGVDCFDRAVDLLETYNRLFVLSRLYQKHKMSADVLATWRRIVEGEQDDGGELGDGEQRVRTYLSNVSNPALVQEYGIWLATRNPKLGVQVFADDKGKAKFVPTEVVAMLREEAPDAVKYYLEHLVFGKGNAAYVNELITYYLDIVIEDLQSSAASREGVAATYEAYRALRPPKPTYRQFLTDNAPPDDEVWHSRLRLLQLLGGTHDYDSEAIRARITSALPAPSADKQLLVPEAIILDGRARRHEDALRLLVHRLGDYDTAVSYCLRGGASLYGSTPGRRDSLPSTVDQTHLFRVLLREFLLLDDLSDRVEQTGALLEQFGGWFDVLEVLELIPDSWSVDVAARFLATALRRLVRERHESMVARALSSAENLRVNYDLLVVIDEKGPVVDAGP